MAHEFKIMNQSGTITTYTSYDDIPNNSTLKHVISFKPDLGTEIDSNEIAFYLADHQDQLDTIEIMYE